MLRDGDFAAPEGVPYGQSFAIVTLTLTCEARIFATHTPAGVFSRPMLANLRPKLAQLGKIFANHGLLFAHHAS